MAASFIHTTVKLASGNVNGPADFFGSILVGAAMGYATHGIGQLFGPVGSATFSGEIGRSLAHGVSNTMFSGISGHNGNPISTLATGGLGSLGGSAFMMYGGRFSSSPLGVYAFSGLSGGLASEFTGGDFWEGAAMGTLNAGLNHLHQKTQKYWNNKLIDKISQALELERQRAIDELNSTGPYIDQEIAYDLSVKKASDYIPNAKLKLGDEIINSDVYYNYSEDNVIRHVTGPRSQPTSLMVPAGVRIKGYMAYLRNRGNWDTVLLRMSNNDTYMKYKYYIRGL
ncbi:MAG: hypothetical protein U5L09_19340 [Bacteroidales bacterium]|nr:hypothetical protein [Bacteroidales bacterium]